MRRVVRIGVALVVLVGIALVGVRLYFRSDRFRREVVARLEASAGVPVAVDSASMALFGDTVLRGVRLYEREGSEPWATVDEVRANYSAVKAIRGYSGPGFIALNGVSVRLRFDSEGNLLTQFPAEEGTSELYPLVLQVLGGTVTLEQEGRPPMVVRNVNGEASWWNGYGFGGFVDDPSWGQWRLHVAFNDSFFTTLGFSITLENPHAYVAQEKFENLPFVPARVCQELKLEGPSGVKFTYGLDNKTGMPRYRVALQPNGAAVAIPAIGLKAEDLHGGLVIEDGLVTLNDLTGRTCDGTARVSGELDFRKVDDRFSLDVAVEKLAVPLLPAQWQIPEGLKRFGGRLTGKAKLTIVSGKEVTTSGAGEGVITGAQIAGKEAEIRLKLRPGDGGFRFEGGEQGRARFATSLTTLLVVQEPAKKPTEPQKKQSYLDVSLGLKDVDVAKLLEGFGVTLPVSVAGKVSFKVQASLPAANSTELKSYRASGTASSPRLVVGGVPLEKVEGSARLADGVLTLSQLKALLYGGNVAGEATLPLAGDKPGTMRLRIADVDLAALTRDVPAIPVKVEGKASGTVNATVTAGKNGAGPEVHADLDLTAPKLRLQGAAAERVTGTVTYRNGEGEYRLKGAIFGGTFQLDGRFPPKTEKEPRQGRLRLERVQVARVLEWLGVRDFGPLTGTADLRLDFDLVGGRPVGSGSLTVGRLRWGERDVADGVRAEVRLSERELRLLNITGTLGEGLVRGQVNVNLSAFDRSWFTLALDRVGAERLLAPWPELAAAVQGPVDARLRGTLGSEWRGGGDIVLTRGRLFGVEVSEWRLPLTFAYVPGRGRGQIDIAETNAQLARGRLTGRASVGLGVGTRLEGNVRFYGVDLRTLLRQATELVQVGAGQVAGRIDFSGSDVRSFADVSAAVDASFSQTQALQLPVLSVLTPYVAPGQANATFQSGELRGRLANGLFRVQKLSLTGQVVNLFGDGTVGTDGRLNLDVTATTGRVGVNPSLLRLIGLRVPVVGPIPLGLILEVTDYLSNRSVHLRVTGTTRSPSVRLEPLSLLTDEAVRYFLNRYSVPLP